MNSQQKTISLQLETPEPEPIAVDPARTALVIVDMQNDCCKPEGEGYKGASRRGAVIQPIQRLLQRCRAAGAQIIYVQYVKDLDSPLVRLYGKDSTVMRGTWGAEIAEELTPLPGETIVEKHSKDCFNNTRLEAVLAEKGIIPGEWTTIVVGLGLTNCVGCAVAGFSVRQYRVALPIDCTASYAWDEELIEYQRFMQPGFSYNVTLTDSNLIEFKA